MSDAPDIITLRARLEEAERKLAIIRERDRRKSASYRARYPERARESRRKTDKKRRAKPQGLPPPAVKKAWPRRSPASDETKMQIRASQVAKDWTARFKTWRTKKREGVT